MAIQNENEILQVKQRNVAALLSRPNVTGVDMGFKYRGGQCTDEVVIRVFVRQKRDDVSEVERIPKMIDGIPTDVMQGEFTPVEDPYNPLLGGVPIGDWQGYETTLGAIVVDRSTGKPLLLTSMHGKAARGIRVCQPGGLICDPDSSEYYIGEVERVIYNSKVDAGVCNFKKRDFVCRILDIGPVRSKPATMELGLKVLKRGMRTGLTYGIVEGCDGTHTIAETGGIMEDLACIRADTSRSARFCDHGDSGSAVVVPNLIGCNIAGMVIGKIDDSGVLGVATPIQQILDELNVNLCGVDPFEKPSGFSNFWKSVLDILRRYVHIRPPIPEPPRPGPPSE